MPLNDQEREQIIEEERVRWETRRLLMQEAWAQRGHCYGGHAGYGRRHRVLHRVLGAVLVLGGLAWLFTHLACRF